MIAYASCRSARRTFAPQQRQVTPTPDPTSNKLAGSGTVPGITGASGGIRGRGGTSLGVISATWGGIGAGNAICVVSIAWRSTIGGGALKSAGVKNRSKPVDSSGTEQAKFTF